MAHVLKIEGLPTDAITSVRLPLVYNNSPGSLEFVVRPYLPSHRGVASTLLSLTKGDHFACTLTVIDDDMNVSEIWTFKGCIINHCDFGHEPGAYHVGLLFDTVQIS